MNNEIKKEKKSVLNIVLNSILTLLAILSIVFINMMSYAKGIIFGAQNSDYVNQLIEDELGIKKESNKRQVDSRVVESITYAVPTEGYVENIYFNTDLSVEEVLDILSSVVGEDNGNYFIATDTNSDESGRYPSIEVRYQDGIYVIVFIENDTGNFIFSSNQIPVYGVDFVGWNPTFTGSISYDFSIFFTDQMSEDVYGKNNLLTPLVATVDYGEYAVPSSGLVEDIYFNTSITSEEVLSIFESLDYISGVPFGFSEGTSVYVIFTDEILDKVLIVGKDENLDIEDDIAYFVMSAVDDSFYNIISFTVDSGVTPGRLDWFHDISYDPLVIDSNNFLSSYSSSYGLSVQNNNLINFLSVKPYEGEQTPIFEKFLTDASDIVLGFVTILSTAAISLSDVFIDSSNKLTIVGSAMVLALAVGVIYLLFRMVRGLIKSNIRG